MDTTARPSATASRRFTPTKRSMNAIIWLALMVYLALQSCYE